MSRLEQQMKFILEMDKLKEIKRQTYIANGKRLENDTEHSWHLALMCAVLSEYAEEKIDVLKTMTMVLIHDIVEIDAGDTYAYDVEGNKSKKDRETKAANRLFGLLPKDQEVYFRQLWEEFELGETIEAKFAATLDKVQPIMLNDATGGIAWEEHEVRLEQIMERNDKTGEGSSDIWEFAKQIIDKNVNEGHIKEV